jgi:asparagine synthase (glutamine-hydrolysing)
MCGFAGVVVWDEKYRVSVDTLTGMAAAVAHRGPDGQGIHLNHNQAITPDHPQVGLAFRRLAILDPDPRSDQPFTDGRYWLVFNGEIYNFRELKKELSVLLPGRQWLTTGDTEVLLAAYAAWGEKCVDRLNGMFAFAVWDEVEKTLFLARDRMGQKPLYWAARTIDGNPWTGLKSADDRLGPPFSVIAFASEITSLVALPWITREIDEAGINGYLRWGYIPTPRTAFKNIRSYLPSMYGSASFNSASAEIYFNRSGINSGAGKITVEPWEAVATTRTLVRQAVSRQLVSDVPIGCLLSGGMDSSIVAASMRAAFGPVGKIHTFSLGFGDPLYDESEFAQAVADHLGTEHHRCAVTPNAAADLPMLAKSFGEPFGDSSALPTHYLAQEVRSHVKVVLSGDGGDELFGGYDRYRAMHIAAALDHTPEILRRAAAGEIWQKLPGKHPKSAWVKLKRFMAPADSTPIHRYLKIMSIFSAKQISELLSGPEAKRSTASEWELISKAAHAYAELRGPAPMALAIDRMTYLPDDLLTKVDRCSMLHGLEVRSPFMDHELVTFAAGLTTDQLLKGGPKRMLREAFADDLPAWVFKRKKMGFAVPIGDWFRGPLRAMLEDTLFAAAAFGRSHFDMAFVRKMVDDHQSGRVDHSQRLYALLMLELWWENVARASRP